MKGLIGFDIDGTLTDDHVIAPDVMQMLNHLSKDWKIAFVTGRTFSFGYRTLESCSFPYFYTIYNGATTLQMPERRVISSHRIDRQLLKEILKRCDQVGIDPFIHLGYEHDDLCLWRPSKHQDQAYYEKRQAITKEPWKPVDQFDVDSAAYVKLFGLHEELEPLAAHYNSRLLRDPLREGWCILLITHPKATKGRALKELAKGLPTIAAGDDFNDLTMLEEADVAIAMAHAPDELKEVADITTKSIIEGIHAGIDRIRTV